MSDEEEILKKDLFPLADLSGSAQVVDISVIPREPLADLCHRIKQQLATDHVRCPEAVAFGLQNEIRNIASPLRGLLATGFARLVTIEVSRGRDEHDNFEFDRIFLPYVRDVLFSAFEIDPLEVFHPEQIVQVLKDEPPSLFCFLDSHLVPNLDAQRLRSFTQEHHRVLFCGQVDRSDRHDAPARQSDKPEIAPGPRIKVQLVVVQGKPEGKVIPLAGPSFKIGRGEMCHLRPNSEHVSREHAVFTLSADSVHIRHLGHVSKTFVNGQALASDAHRLNDRDLVTIGPLTFAVCILPAPIDSWLVGQDSPASVDDSSKVSLATVEIIPPTAASGAENQDPDEERLKGTSRLSEQGSRPEQPASDAAADILRRMMNRRAEKSS